MLKYDFQKNQGHAQWFKLTSSLIFDLKSNTISSVQKQNKKTRQNTALSFFWYVCVTLWISDPQLKQVYMREGVRSSSERLKGGGGHCVVGAGGRARKAQSGMRQTRAGKPVTSAQAHFGLIFKESQVYNFFSLHVSA